jgi:hypothetical protein
LFAKFHDRKEDWQQTAVVNTLGKMDNVAEQIAVHLAQQELHGHNNPYIRHDAVVVLSVLGSGAKPVLGDLMNALDDEAVVKLAAWVAYDLNPRPDDVVSP